LAPSKSASKTRVKKAAGVVGDGLPYVQYCLRRPRLATGFFDSRLSLSEKTAGVVGGGLPYVQYCLRGPRLAIGFFDSRLSRLRALALLLACCSIYAVARVLIFVPTGLRDGVLSRPRC